MQVDLLAMIQRQEVRPPICLSVMLVIETRGSSNFSSLITTDCAFYGKLERHCRVDLQARVTPSIPVPNNTLDCIAVVFVVAYVNTRL